MRVQKFDISYCICPDCGLRFPIPRKKSKRREHQHIKDLWCPNCRKVQHMTEIRAIDIEKNIIGETLPIT